MTTAIRWSYDRLTSDAQLVGDRLALFERGFTIEAVEAVCPDVPDVIEALASIVDARLVRQMESRADVRFVVLGTVRAFARERLLARPDLMRSRELLAAYLTRRAEDSRAHLYGADGDLAQARFDDNAADIAAAVDWALESGRRSIAVELHARRRGLLGRRRPPEPGAGPGRAGPGPRAPRRPPKRPGCWPPPPCSPTSSATTTRR